MEINLKCTMWELQVKCYLGQDENYSPGDSTSDNWENAPKKQGEDQYMCESGKEEYMNQVRIELFSVGVEGQQLRQHMI